MGDAPHIRELRILGMAVRVDDALGHAVVAHDGRITWDELQTVKNCLWGPEARAIEVFPSDFDVVNTGDFRHLWRLGAGDFCPDLLGHCPSNGMLTDALEDRHLAAWSEADAAFAAGQDGK